MGPSGAGKTSLLNALSGIGHVVEGTLCFNGTEQPRRSASFLCTVVRGRRPRGANRVGPTPM
jgi:ABC-type lipoprotein export system ATPase subunit